MSHHTDQQDTAADQALDELLASDRPAHEIDDLLLDPFLQEQEDPHFDVLDDDEESSEEVDLDARIAALQARVRSLKQGLATLKEGNERLEEKVARQEQLSEEERAEIEEFKHLPTVEEELEQEQKQLTKKLTNYLSSAPNHEDSAAFQEELEPILKRIKYLKKSVEVGHGGLKIHPETGVSQTFTRTTTLTGENSKWVCINSFTDENGEDVHISVLKEGGEA